ncbi:hypothetical protein LIER_08082 [Lithospermum erythrorhizon]|uniref:Uncharacterized protein n=1 Tax=Lithospermum erythrorhizon TaxID=34254 RepID=A0AAV3PEJ3_LITER
MEAVMLHSSQNQTITPNKSQITNSMKMMHLTFNSRAAENYFFEPNFHAGILQTPHPFFYHSFPQYCLPQNTPTVFPQKNGNRKTNCKINDRCQTPRRSNISSNSPRKGGTMMKTTKKVVNVSLNDLNPKNVPKHDVPKMMVSSTIPSKGPSLTKTSDKYLKKTIIDNQVDKIYNSVIFTISPPPSSLPLPTFSLRPKLTCKNGASGIDAGATDDLRRLLRLP